jgi:hypothetical protein
VDKADVNGITYTAFDKAQDSVNSIRLAANQSAAVDREHIQVTSLEGSNVPALWSSIRVAETVNPLVLRWLFGGNGKGLTKTGVVIGDWFGPGLIDAILARNLNLVKGDLSTVETDFQSMVHNLAFSASGSRADQQLSSFFGFWHAAVPGPYWSAAAWRRPSNGGVIGAGPLHAGGANDDYGLAVWATTTARPPDRPGLQTRAEIQAVVDPLLADVTSGSAESRAITLAQKLAPKAKALGAACSVFALTGDAGLPNWTQISTGAHYKKGAWYGVQYMVNCSAAS